MTGSEFSPAARAAILEATHHACAGCGTTRGINTQHRHARGMGGTPDAWHGAPCNGVALCGSGAHGCHGWTEAHPDHALALGWRIPTLTPGELPGPFWTRHGWRKWIVDGDPADPRSWLVALIGFTDRDSLMILGSPEDAFAAIDAYAAYLKARQQGRHA